MASETTMLLRRAVALRHTPEAQAFWSAVLDALSAGTHDPEDSCRVVCAAVRDLRSADSVKDWLSGLAGSCAGPVDPALVLARADAVAAALAGVRAVRRPGSTRSATTRCRVRELMVSTPASLDRAMA